VVPSFAQAAAQYGSFKFVVGHGTSPQKGRPPSSPASTQSPPSSAPSSSSSSPLDADQADDGSSAAEGEVVSIPAAQPTQVASVRRECTYALPNGSELTLSVDKERFHCCEVLFETAITDESAGRGSSVVSAVLTAAQAVDPSVRADVCRRIVVFGRTSLVPGLLTRLEEEVRDGLRHLGVDDFAIVGMEERDGGAPTAPWAGASKRVTWSSHRKTPAPNIMDERAYHTYGPDVVAQLLL
jgi:hypothetical protein